MVLLELLGAGTGPLLDAELAQLKTLSQQRFLPGQTTFVAVVTAHVAACAVAVMLALDMLGRTPRSRPFTVAGIAVAALFVAALPLGAALVPGNGRSDLRRVSKVFLMWSRRRRRSRRRLLAG